MGIFGRDDRTTQTPAAAAVSGHLQSAQNGAPSGSTVIAGGNRVKGTISGSGDVHVEGQLEGEVDGTGRVRVATQGTVSGTVNARTVVVAGTVLGDITAVEDIQLEASATVEGNISAPRIRIAEGATFDGKISMKQRAGTSSAKR